ncbi:putative transcription factor MYB family [Rosa chinensis]|uniref:Putative transcription factor MYB family n=1 Tax=Rosa chinensis TaxID=74649 RepID=A0A2P6PUD4_ROSCH|nr:putative transcription factor MYB family [Rosa chinensis]
MATPPSPTASPSASPVSATATATKKPHPIPWTHEETVHLIQSYQDKWYELRRGQLKASQWEEVAVTVAARCGYEYTEPSKTATQCRHKMEKLRQRHRSVKKRLGLSFGSGWPYFDLMERLEQGPMPISARRPYQEEEEEDEEAEEEEEAEDHGGEEEEVDEEEEDNYRKLQSLDYILRRPAIVNRFSSGAKEGHFRDSTAAKRPRESAADDDGYYGDVVDGQRGTEMVVELATEIRGFAKRLIGVENMRMEIMRETERCRLEMENKRIDMILQSQRKIVDSIDRAFGLD